LFSEERADLHQWLTGHDWVVTTIEALDLMWRYDRTPGDELKDLTPRSVFIEGRLIAVSPPHQTGYCES
jgi:hypothetical protein